ncbi:MAG: WYL domain-containing protein, partial [Chloroflexi bacterium]|nr:WYL domain-containing protein [Chloroflexota bacterium]
FADIADELISMLDGALIVAHNAAFDAGFLGMELGLCGEGVDTAVYHTPWLCTLTLARNYFHFGRNNLTHIARQLGVRMGTAHRALSDVYMTADILKQMVHQLQKQRMHTVGDLLHAQGGAITMPLLDTVPLPVLLRDAIANRHRLKMNYQSKNGTYKRTITPLYATQHNGVSYLIAYCHLRNDQRTFRLDRIINMDIL